MDNLKAYKNGEGFKHHISGNFVIKNSLIAENGIGMRHGVWNTGLHLEITVFQGFTDDSQNRKNWKCPNGDGIRPSYNTALSGSEDAVKLTNVTFSKYMCGKRSIVPYYDSRSTK